MKHLILFIFSILFFSCIDNKLEDFTRKNETRINCTNEIIDSLLILAKQKLNNEIIFNEKQTFLKTKVFKNFKFIVNDSLLKPSQEISKTYVDNYIKQSELLANRALKNILLESNETLENNLYLHYEIQEIFRQHTIAEKKLTGVIKNYKSKFDSTKEDILDTIKSWGFATMINKKYTFNREWIVSRNTDSTFLTLQEIYIRKKDTLINQQVDFNKGIIDSTSSDFYKTEFKKINDTLYKGKISVFNSSIHSLNQKLNERKLTLILHPKFKIIESKNKNHITFTTNNDTLVGLIQDMCFFQSDSINGQPMLRMITTEKPIDNKYRTNNKLIETFDIMKNER